MIPTIGALIGVWGFIAVAIWRDRRRAPVARPPFNQRTHVRVLDPVYDREREI